MASMILSHGESSRLYKKLVHDRAVAERISAWTDDHRGPDQFTVMGVLTDKGKLPDVEAALGGQHLRPAAEVPFADDAGGESLRLGELGHVEFGLGQAVGRFRPECPEDAETIGILAGEQSGPRR